MQVLWVAAFGALGTVLRYGASLACITWLGPAFPYGTLVVNLVGSFALGVLAAGATGLTIFGFDARPLLGVGLLGGFTTYSSFNLETLGMIEQGSPSKALGYAALTLLGCLLAGALGLALGRSLGR